MSYYKLLNLFFCGSSSIEFVRISEVDKSLAQGKFSFENKISNSVINRIRKVSGSTKKVTQIVKGFHTFQEKSIFGINDIYDDIYIHSSTIISTTTISTDHPYKHQVLTSLLSTTISTKKFFKFDICSQLCLT